MVFLIEFTFLFYCIYLHCCISISSLNAVTLWNLIFPILVPRWILVVTFVSTVMIVHGSFPFWTLRCGVYRPYGLISFANLISVVLLRSVWRRLFSYLPMSYERDIKDCVMFECLCCAWWDFLYFMVCFANSPWCIVNECINVSRFNWIGHVYFSGAHHHLIDALTNGDCFADS